MLVDKPVNSPPIFFDADLALKLGVVTGNGLYKMGARMRGESYEQLCETTSRNFYALFSRARP